MKLSVLFICGCLEPGRNGVGDYTRRLAGEMARQGNGCGIIALNDKYIKVATVADQTDEHTNILTQRLPDLMLWEEKAALIKDFVAKINPDWISLQYVPFSFNARGINFGLPKKLSAIANGKKWQIMFHELNVGMEEGSSLKHAAWGLLQQYQIKELISVIRPEMINTHVDVYKKILKKLGAEVKVLPLFSNIPVACPEKIADKEQIDFRKNGQLDLVIFGGIHHGAPVDLLAKEAAEYAQENNINVNLMIVGKSGTAQENWIKEWKQAGLTVENLGEQSEKNISDILGKAFLGLFTTPLALVEKSGSVAAMREHKLHLLCVARPWAAKGVLAAENPFGLKEFVNGGLVEFLNTKPDFSFLPTVNNVAREFSANLINHT